MRSKHLYTVLATLALGALLRAEPSEMLTPDEVRNVRALYKEIAEKLNALPEHPNLPVEIPIPEPPEEEIDIYRPHRFDREQIFAGTARALVVGLDRTTGAIRLIKNDRLSMEHNELINKRNNERREKKLPEVPAQNDYVPMTLSPSEAIEKARQYLKLFNIEIPSEYRLVAVDFGIKCRGLWIVKWQPFYQGFPFDDFATPPPEISVCFHESKGLMDLARTSEAPRPAPTEIKVTQDEAIKMALAALEKSPLYRRSRKPGFVATSVTEATLKVVSPNWLLNPKKATSIKAETRVCWAIMIKTRPSSEDLAKLRLNCPDIIIYIDANSGETVGANFS